MNPCLVIQVTPNSNDWRAAHHTLTEARTRSAAYENLLAERDKRERDAKIEQGRYQEVQRKIDELASARKALADARKELGDLDVEAKEREQEVDRARKRENEARKALDQARGKREAVEAQTRLAQDAARFLGARRTVQEAETLLTEVAAIDENLKVFRGDRSRLIAPETKTLKRLRKALRDRETARVRLDAALITLEITPAAEGTLNLLSAEHTGEAMLKAGHPFEVKGSPVVEVEWEGIGRVRARGPAAESVEELRDASTKVEEEVRSLTQPYGTEDLEMLEARHAEAGDLDARIEAAEQRRTDRLAGRRIEEIEAGLEKARAEETALLAEHADWNSEEPDSLALQTAADSMRREFGEQIENVERDWTTAQEALAAVMEKQTKIEARRSEVDQRLNGLAEKVTELEADGRSDSEREDEKQRIAIAWDAAKGGLEEAEKKLAEFPGDPRDEVGRIETRLKAENEEAIAALEREKLAEGKLQRLSQDAPYSAMIESEEEVARLESDLAREDIRARGVKLLHDTLEAQRREAVAAVARPVEDRALRTLQRIAGSRFEALHLGEQLCASTLTPRLADSPVAITEVSGGETEQVHLAVRLALATELAQDERQLVVLDDTLVYTDAGRFTRILGIFEEEAQERLQFVILTCHPERYRGLTNAHFTTFQ